MNLYSLIEYVFITNSHNLQFILVFKAPSRNEYFKLLNKCGYILLLLKQNYSLKIISWPVDSLNNFWKIKYLFISF